MLPSGNPIFVEASTTNGFRMIFIVASKIRNSTGRPLRTRPTQRRAEDGEAVVLMAWLSNVASMVRLLFAGTTNGAPANRHRPSAFFRRRYGEGWAGM